MHIKGIIITCVCVFGLCACKADLIVSDVAVTWNDATQQVNAEIKNIGNANAGAFMVYFDGEESPVSPNHRPQVRLQVNGLAKGGSVTLTADFSPLAHPDNRNLANVYQIHVAADAKNAVPESNETNNDRRASL